MQDVLDPYGPVYMMANSGATKANFNQIRQMAGMRGLMADPSGRIIELPIRSNFREGLTVLEYFISTHGARKGLADTALRTADVRLPDPPPGRRGAGRDRHWPRTAAPTSGIWLTETGRPATCDETVPQTASIGPHRWRSRSSIPRPARSSSMRNEEIDERLVGRGSMRGGRQRVSTCRSVADVRGASTASARCATAATWRRGQLVEIGEAVGIIAAQSIGEPGTQLTMRTFHTGGVAARRRHHQGLPRVEELFEARVPKGKAILAEIDGVGRDRTSRTTAPQDHVVVYSEVYRATSIELPTGYELLVADGDEVSRGRDRAIAPSRRSRAGARRASRARLARSRIERAARSLVDPRGGARGARVLGPGARSQLTRRRRRAGHAPASS